MSMCYVPSEVNGESEDKNFGRGKILIATQ